MSLDNMILEEMRDAGMPEEEIQEFASILQQGNSMLENFELENGEYRLKVKIVNKSNNPLPTYAKFGDSGFDLRANLPDGPVVIPAGGIKIIPTGNFFQIPAGWELQARSRSGLAAKNGVMVLNSPGTIDSGYRGEVMAIMFNTGAIGDFTVNHGDRICQGVITTVSHNVKFVAVDNLDESERGDGKFGSSGVK